MELSKTSLEALLRPALATLFLSLLTPLFTYALARRLLGLKREEAAALAAHYGSVSAVTFLAALAFVHLILGIPLYYALGVRLWNW